MTRWVEFLNYELSPGTGAFFHAIMTNVSVPLHRKAGIDVIAFGRSAHSADCYFLVRAFDDLRHLEAAQDAFYKSDAWRDGPRSEIVSRIVASLRSVIPMESELIEELRIGIR